MAVLAALAVTVMSTSAFAIPVGVGSILDAHKAAVAAKAGHKVGTKSCPNSQHQKAAANKKAVDKSAGLTSLSRWFL